MSASHPTRRNSIKLKNSRYSRQRTGRLFFIFQIQNCNDQKSYSQKHHKFLICTHNNHHLPTGYLDWVRARPPAARLNILYCHGAVVHWFKIRAKWELIRPHPVIMGAVSRNFQYAIVTYSAAHIQG